MEVVEFVRKDSNCDDRTFILRAAAAALAAAILRLEVLSKKGITRSLVESGFDPRSRNLVLTSCRACERGDGRWRR